MAPLRPVARTLLSLTVLLLLSLVLWLSPRYAAWFTADYPQEMAQNLAIVWGLLLAWLGACIGSFLNVVIYRLPRGRSIAQGGSACPKCGRAIRAWDNVPVLSWVWLGGHCRGCGEPISLQYPTIELLASVVFLWIGGVVLWPVPDEFGGHVRHSALPLLGTTMLLIHWACLLLVGAHVEHDGWPLPRSLIIYAWVVQLGLAGLAYALPNTAPPAVTSLSAGPWWSLPLVSASSADWLRRVLGLLLGASASYALALIGANTQAHRSAADAAHAASRRVSWRNAGHGWALTGWALGPLGLAVSLAVVSLSRWASVSRVGLLVAAAPWSLLGGFLLGLSIVAPVTLRALGLG